MEKEDFDVSLKRTTETYESHLSWYDNSMLEDYRRCPQRFYNRHYRGLSRIGEESSALDFGTLIHKSLDILWAERDLKKSLQFLMENYHIIGDEKRSLARGLAILRQYAKERNALMDEFEVIECEFTFEETYLGDLGNTTFNYRGRIDKILLHKTDGFIYGVDHKTTSLANDAMLNAWSLSPQFIGYSRKIHNKYPNASDTFFVDAIKINPKTTELIWLPIKIERDLRLRHRDQINMEIKQLRSCLEHKSWPMSAPHGCTFFMRLCEYFPLCSHSPDVREMIRQTEYVINP